MDNLSESRVDEVFDLLSNPYRREMIMYLQDNPETTVEEIATHLEEEHDNGKEESLDEVRATLHHSHLPKMDSVDVIEYDGGKIEYTGDIEVEEVLDSVRN